MSDWPTCIRELLAERLAIRWLQPAHKSRTPMLHQTCLSQHVRVAGRVPDTAQHHVHCALHLGVHMVAVGVDERRGPGQQLGLHVCQLRRAGAQRAGLVHLGLMRQEEAGGQENAVLAGS